ncbi:hypothetical protein JOM56_013916 [Amanita muscaria]
MPSTQTLLRAALPLIQTHGFTRDALARSVLSLTQHKEPLSDQAVSFLFGHGDDARRTLIKAWLDEGITRIRDPLPNPTLAQILHERLKYNEPVLSFLPEAFALLISPSNRIPPLDPLPALQHVAQIANEACWAVNDRNLYLSWYTNRASIAAIYSAAELHQLASPQTAHGFLDSLLESEKEVKRAVEEVGVYAEYIGKSWIGIGKSWGVV